VTDVPAVVPDTEAGGTSVVEDDDATLVPELGALTEFEADGSAPAVPSGAESAPVGVGEVVGGSVTGGASAVASGAEAMPVVAGEVVGGSVTGGTSESLTEGTTGRTRLATRLSR